MHLSLSNCVHNREILVFHPSLFLDHSLTPVLFYFYFNSRYLHPIILKPFCFVLFSFCSLIKTAQVFVLFQLYSSVISSPFFFSCFFFFFTTTTIIHYTKQAYFSSTHTHKKKKKAITFDLSAMPTTTTATAATTTPSSIPTKRYSFMNDYSEGMHPKILEAMISENNGKQNPGYGLDVHCAEAARLICKAVDAPNAEVHFISGGTQTNLIAIAVALRPWECVIATQLGHISTHETGAIEATGHKVLNVHSTDGKMRVADIAATLHEHTSEHMVLPRMVYISNTTEVGTQYSKAELEEISTYCRSQNLLLFVDGARLASALASPANDITLADMARLTDLFYIGATKVGGLFGEALVVVNDALKPNMRFLIKQRGALLAKGWMLGIQFEVLMKNNLIFELGAHSNKTAAIIRHGLEECGFKFAYNSTSNQQFPIMPLTLYEKIAKEYDCMLFEDRRDGTVVVRFVTSWATPEDACHEFVSSLKKIVAAAAAVAA